MDKTGRKEIIIYLSLSIAVFAYILFRAIFGPMIHDEAETFFIYVRTGTFIPPNCYIDANNHLLNSLLTFIAYKVLGDSPVVLRLPNVLAFLVYVYYTFKTGRFINDRISRWAFYICFLFTHFIIEFFAYSRGYGMSMAFLVASVYYLIAFAKKPVAKIYLFHSLFMMLTVLANLSLMNTFILSQLAVIIVLLIQERKNRRLWIQVALMAALIVLPYFVVMTNYSFMLRKHGAFYYGSLEGFWDMTVDSLSQVLFRISPIVFSYSALAAFVVCYTLLLVYWIKKRNDFLSHKSLLVYPYLFAGNLFFTIALSEILKVNYPQDRVAMYFFLLFAGAIVFASEWFGKKYKYLLFVPMALVVVQFVASANPYFSSYYPNISLPASFFDYIEKESKKSEYPPTVEAYHLYRTEWAYNNIHRQNLLGVLHFQSYPSFSTEYLIALKKDTVQWENDYNPVVQDNYSDLILLKRKTDMQYRTVCTSDTTCDIVTYNEYYGLLKIKTDTLNGKDLRFDVALKLRTQIAPFITVLIVKAVDSIGNETTESIINLDRCFLDWDIAGGREMKSSLVISKLPAGTKEIGVFLLNGFKSRFQLFSYHVKVSEIQNQGHNK